MYSHPKLLKRIVKSKIHSNHYESIDALCDVPRQSYKIWSADSMYKAIKAVEEGASIRVAAEKYSVPKTSLHDRVSGKVDIDARPGPNAYLSFEEEEELASFLLQCAKIGYPHTKCQVLALVSRILHTKGIDTTVTNGWWERFCKRHSQLTLKTAMPVSHARAAAADPEVLNKYFDILEQALRQNDIFNRPVHIFNCDETGVPLNPKCLKIVDKKGSQNPSYIGGNNKSQITVLACTCAAGYAIPPFVLFKRKSFNPELAKNEVPGTLYGLCDSGWMTQDLFHHWFTEHFLLYAPQVRPLLLLLDGHSTHYSPETISLAADHKIMLFVLPPNTTHITQALDRGCFGPLKTEWRNVCHQFFVDNPGRTNITVYDFCGLFSKAWTKSFTMKNIQSSFRVTGICPFSRSLVENYMSDTEEDNFSIFRPDLLAKKSGLKYLPLYSPCKTKPCMPSVVHTDDSDIEEFDVCSDGRLKDRWFKESSVPPSNDSSSISKFLIPPTLPRKLPTKKKKSSGLVLTSEDHIKLMKEKEGKKLEDAKRKAEKKEIKKSKTTKKTIPFKKQGGFESFIESDQQQSDCEVTGNQ